jgi:hypothetical protein
MRQIRDLSSCDGLFPLLHFRPLNAECHGWTPLFLRDNMFHSPDLSVGQPDFYAMRMFGRIGQNIFDGPARKLAGPLILFQYDIHLNTRSNRGPFRSIHHLSFPCFSCVEFQDSI